MVIYLSQAAFVKNFQDHRRLSMCILKKFVSEDSQKEFPNENFEFHQRVNYVFVLAFKK